MTRLPLRRALALTLALAALQIAATLAWIAADAFPAGQEVCEHQLFARKIANELAVADTPSDIATWAARNRRLWTRATGVHTALAPALLAYPGDDTRLASALVGATSLLLLALATFALAHALTNNPATGLLAAALALLAPGVWGSARGLGVDLPLAVAVTALAAWLVARPPWRSLRQTAACGLVAGALCLVKAQLVLWVPWLVLASLAQHPTPARTRLTRLATFTAAAALGSAWFWAGDLQELTQVARWHAVALDNPSTAVSQRWTPAALAYYPTGLALWCGLPALPCLLLGLTTIARDPRARPILVTLAAALVIHTLIAVKWVRYLLPAVPLLCALAAAGLSRRQRPPLRLLAATLAAALALQIASLTALPGWLADAELVRPPVTQGWRDDVHQLLDQVTTVDPRHETIGLQGPDAWDGDDFSRLELRALERWPLAAVLRNSVRRWPTDAHAFARARDINELTLLLIASDPTTGPPPRPHGWRHVATTELVPAVTPLPGAPLGPPLRLDAWRPR